MKTAPIVIDVQSALFDDVPRPEDAADVIERINRLTHDAKEAGAPIAFVPHQDRESPLAAGGPGWRFAAALKVEPGDTVVAKATLVADAHSTRDKAHAKSAAIRAHQNATLADIRSFGVEITAAPSLDIVWR